MANILDYLKWRGDLSFDAAPFCEVDNYILAKIGCPDFTGIVPQDAESVSIGDAVTELFADGNDDRTDLGPLASPSILPMLRLLPDTARFSSLRLSGFVNRVDFRQVKQFSALTLILPDGTNYVSFRGTDDTIIAWKENFYMAYMDAIPAQTDAVEYLRFAAEAYPGPIIVGGHSKGGNLAIYAAAGVPPEVQDRITVIYNNDGPGFRTAFLSSEGYGRIKDRIRTIIPRHSIVGNLLSCGTEPAVVQCDKSGIAAHDGFTWEVLGSRFVRCDSLSRASTVLNSALDETLAGMDMAQRKDFIEDLFDVVTSTGAVYLGDFSEHWLRQALEISKKLKGEKEISRFVYGVIQEMAKEILPTGRK